MVFEKVKAILSEQFDVEEDSITAETTLADDLGADSLDVVDLLMSIEDEFEVEIPDEEVENIKTVGALVEYIEGHTNAPWDKRAASLYSKRDSRGIPAFLQRDACFSLQKARHAYIMDKESKSARKDLFFYGTAKKDGGEHHLHGGRLLPVVHRRGEKGRADGLFQREGLHGHRALRLCPVGKHAGGPGPAL